MPSCALLRARLLKRIFMKFHLIKNIMIACFCFPFALNAMISYHLIKTPESKQILILEDCHSLNKQILTNQFSAFLQNIIKTPLTETLPFIVEYDAKNNGEQLESTTITHLINLDKTLKASNQNPLNVIYYEPRGPKSTLLASCIQDISNVITMSTSPDTLLRHYQCTSTAPIDTTGRSKYASINNEIWGKIAQKIKNDKASTKRFTIAEYHTYLESNLTKLLSLVTKYNDNEIIVEIFRKKINTYKDAQQKIKEYFKNDVLEQSFEFAFINHFVNCSTLERLTLYDTYKKTFCEDSDYLFADLLFLDKLLDTIKTKTCACILVGFAHAEKLAQCFEKLNGTILSTKNGHSTNGPLLNELDFKVLLTLLNPELAGKFLEPITQNTCAQCPKVTELKKCSRCKKVWYCSTTCQKKDWNSHKKVCKKK